MNKQKIKKVEKILIGFGVIASSIAAIAVSHKLINAQELNDILKYGELFLSANISLLVFAVLSLPFSKSETTE